MKSHFLAKTTALVTFVFLCVMNVPVQAQPDLTQVLTTSDGSTVSFPENWTALQGTPAEPLILQNEDSSIFSVVFDPAQLAAEVDLPAGGDLQTIFDTARAWYVAGTVSNDEIEAVTINGFDAIRAEFQSTSEGEVSDEVAYLIAFDEDAYGLIIFRGFGTVFTGEETMFEAIAQSFVPEGFEPPTIIEATEGGDCFISVEQANTAALRVGPGFNRSSVLFLPVGKDFRVIGQFTTNDGDVWFQLDKAEVAPQSAANELWVLREDVDESGDCERVADASAPPIVPISAPPATAQPGADPSDTATSGLFTPVVGNWRISFAPNAAVSCSGLADFTAPIAEAGVDSSVYGPLIVSGDGNTMTFFLINLMRMPGTNTFNGSTTLADGTSLAASVTLNSTTILSGTLTSTVQTDGLTCTANLVLTGRAS